MSRGMAPRSGSRLTGSGGSLVDVALAVMVVVAVAGAVLRGGVWLASVIAGSPDPDGGLGPALRALATPLDPASAWPRPAQVPPTGLYWAGTVIVICLASLVGIVGWRVVRRLSSSQGRDDPRRRPGMASAGEAVRGAGSRAVVSRAPVVRPALAEQRRVQPQQVGYRVGRVSGKDLWFSVEDSVLVVGPPRMGKGLHLMIPWVLDAPGAVVATSTRPDTLSVTHSTRAQHGPVAIFDPQQLSGLPGGLRWSPVRGCEHPRTALVRARGLAAGVGFGKTISDADFWAGQTETALRCLLHAAALDGRGPADLYRWSLNPALSEEAVHILTRTGSAASGWSDALDAIVHSDPRTRDSVWLGVRQALAALADPDVMAAVAPREGEAFHPEEFLRQQGTLYLLASSVASASSGPLVAAFVEDITETARSLAARSPGARLDPPLLLALDEIANLTPLPSLPSLMAEGGGSGITTVTVFQSLAQARNRWGEHAADSLWDAATVKIVLGGLAKLRDLDDVARLLGEIDEPTQTLSRGRWGDRSYSVSVRQMPVMPPSVLRTLPFGTAVLLLRHTRPVVVDLLPWTKRRDAAELVANRGEVEAAMAGHRPLDAAASQTLRSLS